MSAVFQVTNVLREIEAKLVGWLAAIPEVLNAVDHEPLKLPQMPCTTLLVTQFQPLQAQTGYFADNPADDVQYGWRLRLYIPLVDYERAQNLLKQIGPQIIAINRDHPTCDGLCDFLRVIDPGGTPIFSHEDEWLAKDFDLLAVRTET